MINWDNPIWSRLFFSDLIPGSTSDNEITVKSGVLDMVESGKGVMTDRGSQSKIYVPTGRADVSHQMCQNI